VGTALQTLVEILGELSTGFIRTTLSSDLIDVAVNVTVNNAAPAA